MTDLGGHNEEAVPMFQMSNPVRNLVSWLSYLSFLSATLCNLCANNNNNSKNNNVSFVSHPMLFYLALFRMLVVAIICPI